MRGFGWGDKRPGKSFLSQALREMVFCLLFEFWLWLKRARWFICTRRGSEAIGVIDVIDKVCNPHGTLAQAPRVPSD
jgi:hypothetical protein